jgi:hypothetical protein
LKLRSDSSRSRLRKEIAMTLGPVQLLVVGFLGDDDSGKIRAELDRLREDDVVRLVDLMVVRKHEDGQVERVRRTDLSEGEAEEMGALVGALIGFGAAGEEGMEAGAELGAERAAERYEERYEGGDGGEEMWFVDDAIPPGTAAAVAILEHRWAIPLREAIGAAGGFHLADAWIHPADLVAIGMLAAEEAEKELASGPPSNGSGG